MKNDIKYTYGEGSMGNYLNGYLVVEGRAFKAEIGKWSRPVEQADAYGYLARDVLAQARTAGVDVQSALALIDERERLLARVREIQVELSGPYEVILRT